MIYFSGALSTWACS